MADEPRFEEALSQLEALVRKLESGELDLEEALSTFEAGVALAKLCSGRLEAAELRIVKLEQGATRLEAATFAYTSTAFPMLTGTLVTAVGFVPVGFARSSAGRFCTRAVLPLKAGSSASEGCSSTCAQNVAHSRSFWMPKTI